MKQPPTLAQRFTLRPTQARIQVKADALATSRESWWIKFATQPRDDSFDAAVKVRFAVRTSFGPLLKDWTVTP